MAENALGDKVHTQKKTFQTHKFHIPHVTANTTIVIY